MTDRRTAFLDSYKAIEPLIRSPKLVARWDEDSALVAFSMRGLAGHLVRAGWAVLNYLESAVDDGATPIEAARYYAAVLPAMGESQHLEVRSRGEEVAGRDASSLIETYSDALEHLGRLDTTPGDRMMQVFGGHVMRLDDYLETRICEILIHADDLAVSLEVDPPRFPPQAWDVALEHLLAVARASQGDRAVLMGFSRRERDEGDALRVF